MNPVPGVLAGNRRGVGFGVDVGVRKNIICKYLEGDWRSQMRIGFDVGPITATRTGVGNYCYFLLKHLLAIGGNHEFLGFSSGRGETALGDFPELTSHRHLPVPTRALYALWEWTGRPRVDRLLGGVDVYHGTNYVPGPTATARRVVTVHDLAFLVKPEYCSPKIVGPFARQIRRFCGEADAILCYSESTKRDVVEQLGVLPEKIAVAPMAVDDAFEVIETGEAKGIVSKRYEIEGPFFLFVSTLEPRKNVIGLLRAFASLAKDFPHRLVLIGAMGWNMEEVFWKTLRELGLEDRVVMPGFVPHVELPAFYGAADAFLFPTHYEGFGLPLLEALHCGCPVVTSNNSSVPEVTGDGALRVDSEDIDGFADAVRALMNDSDRRDALVRRGREHAAKFSWTSCAEATMAVYESVLS